ncbi:MAG: SecDF P1 head subdomain-containing protein [Candidatus Brocadiia bacterium]
MKATIFSLSIAILLTGCTTARTNGPPIRVEFRNAQKLSAPQLKKMVVEGTDTAVYVGQKVFLTERDIKSASLKRKPGNISQLQIVFTSEGKRKFSEATAESVGKPIAIIVDDTLVSAPIIMEKITDPQAVISGRFSQEKARDIADSLNAQK